VGDDFAVPSGHTWAEVTADIDWTAEVAGDLLVVVDRGDGRGQGRYSVHLSYGRPRDYRPKASLRMTKKCGNS
jgi:hypothetical protein